MKQAFTTFTIIIIAILSLNSCDNSKDSREITNNVTNKKDTLDVKIDIDSNALKIDKKDFKDFKVTKEQKPATKQEIINMISEESKGLNKHQKYVQEFFAACSNKDYKKAAKFIAYKGTDKSRINKDSFNPENVKELKVAKMTVDVIYGFLEESKDYKFMSMNENSTPAGNIYEIEVSFFKKGMGINRRHFSVLDSPNGLIIYDMK